MKRVAGKTIGCGAALLALTAGLSPAIGMVDSLLALRSTNPVSLGQLGSISSFTPATQDKRLAAAYARAVVSRNGKTFRFTPTSGSLSGRRSITVLLRSDGSPVSLGDRNAPIGVAPLAFSLDSSRGWRKFILPETLSRKPLDPVVADLGAGRSYSSDGERSRLKANVQLEAHRDVGTLPQTLAGERKLSVDVGSSYSLTRNLNVTAGVRYAGPDNRLAPLTDQRQDNQAVYFGTVFKF